MFVAGKSRYGVRIVTGKQEGGGTSDRGVYIIIVGSKGSSGKVYLTGSLSWFTGKGTRFAAVKKKICQGRN